MLFAIFSIAHLHVLGIAAVDVNTGDLEIRADDKVTMATAIADTAVTEKRQIRKIEAYENCSRERCRILKK